MREDQWIQANGLKFHVVVAGDEGGQPLLLLHGFPEYWAAWEKQIDTLVAAGYRLIIPDLRGYNLSDKPQQVADYRLSILASDAIEIMKAFGYEQFYLAGHDWGAAVAWMVATIYPQALIKLVILNVPYPTILAKAFQKRDWSQIRKSWYMFFFQIPVLPEWLLSVRHHALLTKAMKKSGLEDTFSEADIEGLKEAWSQPGAMKGMINWYRSMFRTTKPKKADGADETENTNPIKQKLKLNTPILILWGEKDIALGKELAERSLEICNNGELKFYPEATHWILRDEGEAISKEMIRFFEV
ncbi:alpha/beta hydrolase [Anaerolineales bacterium]